MPQKLSDINPGELSLVRRGAVRRPWLFTKADEDGLELDPAIQTALEKSADGELEFLKALLGDEAEPELIAKAAALYRLAHAEGLDTVAVAKAFETPADPVDDGYEAVAKADFSAEQRAEMAKNGEALDDGSYPIPDRDYLEKAIHAVGRGSNNPKAEIKAHIVKRARALDATALIPDTWNVQKEDTDMPEGAGAVVPIKKEDGTWDLTGVPEESRSEWETILAKADKADAAEAELAEVKKSEDEALEIAKSERDLRLTREYVSKAEQLGQDAEFGDVLKAAADALPKETFEKLEAVLKANHEQAQTGKLYGEIGRSGVAKNSGSAELDAKADEIRKADSSLSKEQAFAKALRENPDLYERLQAQEA